MSDEKPVTETLETIAVKIGALSRSLDAQSEKMDARFGQVDAQFARVHARITKEIAEAKAQLGVQIEAVDEKVKRVYDEVIAQREHHRENKTRHARFVKRLDDHHLRILALERRKAGGSGSKR